jgi:ribulose-5-phosphate 4-epimerase/fuculose-1-phosphate aldolase
MNAAEVEVLENHAVLGWPPYNAIIRYTEGEGTTDYLAQIEYAREDAKARIDATPELDAHSDTILYDWYEEDHWEWVCTATVAEIVDWAEAVEREAES